MSLTNNNMYPLSKDQWNPHVGCAFDCSYCKPSFQAQLKRWAKGNCQDCYNYKPHTHVERLGTKLPRTGYMQFIFTCSNGDIAFCPTDYLQRINQRIKMHPDRWFLIQSKDPATFKRVKWPRNVILGTTIETNQGSLALRVSKAPSPSKRLADFLEVVHPTKMATIEPAIYFNPSVMVDWMTQLQPCMIHMGYDSKNTGLPEPPLAAFQKLHWELAKRRFMVILKKTVPNKGENDV